MHNLFNLGVTCGSELSRAFNPELTLYASSCVCINCLRMANAETWGNFVSQDLLSGRIIADGQEGYRVRARKYSELRKLAQNSLHTKFKAWRHANIPHNWRNAFRSYYNTRSEEESRRIERTRSRTAYLAMLHAAETAKQATDLPVFALAILKLTQAIDELVYNSSALRDVINNHPPQKYLKSSFAPLVAILHAYYIMNDDDDDKLSVPCAVLNNAKLLSSIGTRISTDSESLVSYFPDWRHLITGIRVKTRPGRLLTKLYPTWDNEHIKLMAAKFNPPNIEFEVLRNDDPKWIGKKEELGEEWYEVYSKTTVDYSCMRASISVKAYGFPAEWNKFGIIMFKNGEQFAGRAIVTWDRDGKPAHFVRVYPAENAFGPDFSEYNLERVLIGKGFTRRSAALNGFALAECIIPHNSAETKGYTIQIPYIDGDIVVLSNKKTTQDGSYLLMENSKEPIKATTYIIPKETSGIIYVTYAEGPLS